MKQTITGRFSTTGPEYIDPYRKPKGTRPCWAPQSGIPTVDYVSLDVGYAQLELRWLSAYLQDKQNT